jgi:hypothetical protein
MNTAKAVLLFLTLTVANASGCGNITGANGGSPPAGDTIYLNHDLSTGDLSQWTHRDFGFGTDTGSNDSGAGYLWYHANVAGLKAAGLTATPAAHASPAASSDSVYLWEPTAPWNYAPYEIWLRTSIMFPSAATISAAGAKGEQPFHPTTGSWNWFLELHNDSNPSPVQENSPICFGILTDGPVSTRVGRHPRIFCRLAGGSDSAIQTLYVYENGVGALGAAGVPLQYDHWYPFLIHVKLSPTAGAFEWFEGSKTIYSNLNIPTLYSRPAGYVSPSYTSLTVTNYRLHASWSSTIYFGPLVVGSTRQAVLSAF